MAEENEEKGNEKATAEERQQRLERMKQESHDRGEDMAKVVRTWLGNKDED